MKKFVTTTAILLTLVAGSALTPVSIAFAQTTGSNAQAEQTEPAEQPDWLIALNTKIDLAQAKVSLHAAKFALEIDGSKMAARKALDEAETSFSRVRDEGNAKAKVWANARIKEVRAARHDIAKTPVIAREKIDLLVERTDDRLQEVGKVVADSDEARLAKKRYAQLEAEAALLKARLAEASDKTGDRAAFYLDEASAWYARAKEVATSNWQQGLSDVSKEIADAKRTVNQERNKAADAITTLAAKAADLVRASDEEASSE